MPEERVAGGSLFERIREAAKPSVRRKPEEALLRSIQSNLRNVLNTRSGSCYGSPELMVHRNWGYLISMTNRWRLKISGMPRPE